jgi:hypothetical protein
VDPGLDLPELPGRPLRFHHQPFACFANSAPGTPRAHHLQDIVALVQAVQSSSSA